MDMDIDNYTVADILSILNIVEPTLFNVTDVANTLIAKMKAAGKDDIVTFFTEARDKVLNELQKQGQFPVENEITEPVQNVWAKNGFNDTSPVNPVYYYDGDSHVVAAENNQFTNNNAPAILSTSLIVIDSQFRSDIYTYQNNVLNSSFTFNLTNPITNAVSLKLYSYQIPTTWYAFSQQAGNTFFVYNGIRIVIPDGNYVPETLATTITNIAQSNTTSESLIVTYDSNANRFIFTNIDETIGETTIIFFIRANSVNTLTNCGNLTLLDFQTLGVNSTLGWLMGIRTQADTTTGNVEIFLTPNSPISSDVAPDTYGPKYFTLSIEDYSNQRLSSGSYNITNTKSYANLTVPDYYNTINVACKLREGSLTQAQIYSINEIIKNNNNLNTVISNNGLVGPTSGSTFATIPLANINSIRPDPYIKFGADLAINRRDYGQPTHLERFTVTLYDDKGQQVNLYDNDWSISLIVEQRLN
jgi:hypothetical protein